MGWHTVAALEDIPAGAGRMFEVGTQEVAVFNCGGAFFAVSTMCTHASAYLHEGTVDEERFILECPLHFAEFDLRTGDVLSGPADEPLEVYALRVEGQSVLVELPD